MEDNFADEMIDCNMWTDQAMVMERDSWWFFKIRYCYCSSCDETFTSITIN
jgi:hypothetical protein